MLPVALLIHRNRGERLVPEFLRPDDHPWLERLLEERSKLDGRPEREWRERLREPLPGEAPADALRLAVYALARLAAGKRKLPVPPRRIRATLFTEAARDPVRALERAAERLGVEPPIVERDLFADLPGERPLAPLLVRDPAAVASRANQLLAEGFLSRAISIRIAVDEDLAGLAGWARRRGLLCTLAGDALELSGPFGLFRHSLLYSRTLMRILPLLQKVRFRLEARCVMGAEVRTVEITDADPPFSTQEAETEPPGHERLAAEIRARAPGWTLSEEEGLVLSGPGGRSHRLELIGFWTPASLRERATSSPGTVLCADTERNCSEEPAPSGLPVIWYRRRLDAERVLRFFEGKGVEMSGTTST